MASDSAPAGIVAVSAGTLILETPNPLDLSIEDLEELAAHIQRVMAGDGLSSVPVKVRGNEPLGAGNQLIDYLHMFLPNAEFIKQTAFTTVIAAATIFMRGRFKRKHESRRQRQINIYGPDGELVRIIKLMSEDAEPESSGPGEE
jgi:hypothetical protein